MKIKIQNLSILMISIMILSISAKSKLPQASLPNNLTPATSRLLSSDPDATIDVIGQASQTVDSDFIKIDIQVVTLASTASVSMQSNNDISNQLQSVITSFGIDLKSLTTTNYSLSPQYNWVDNAQVFQGYQTSNSLELTLSDLKLAGKVLDAISNLKNVQINSIYSGVSSQKVNDTKNSLINAAVADAQRIAGLTLRSMNSAVKSVQTISIDIYGSGISPMPTYKTSFAEAQSTPTLYGSKQEISLSVFITFNVGPLNQ